MKEPLNPALLEANNYSHQVQQNTEFGDMDALGHVNNLAVARFYESTRARWQLDIFGQDLYKKNNKSTIVLVEVLTRYIDEIHYPETLSLSTGIKHIGNSSYICSQAIFRGDHCVGYCEATLVHIINSKPATLTDAVRAGLSRYLVKNL